jgi:hypothetical protein
MILQDAERQRLGVIAKALRSKRMSRDDRLELADQLNMIAQPIIVTHRAACVEKEQDRG